MPILLILAGILVLWIAYNLIQKKSVFGTPRSGCKWKKDARRDPSAAMTRWVCSGCGVEAFSQDSGPPRGCKRHLRSTRL